MRFIHTADWQVGKPFRNFGDKESVLRQARLTAIDQTFGSADDNLRYLVSQVGSYGTAVL